MHSPKPTTQPFRWNATPLAQCRVVIAASFGWMLDAFDVRLYSIVLATLMRAFSMSRTTAGLLNALTLIASALGGLLFGLIKSGSVKLDSASHKTLLPLPAGP